jgi:hypothetical protein
MCAHARARTQADLGYPAGLATYLLMLLQGQSPLQGASSALYAATAPELQGKGGTFIGPQARA